MFQPKLLLSAIAAVLVIGCATSKSVIVPTVKIVDIPPLNTEKTAELGDTIVSKGKIYNYQALDLKNEVHAGDGVFILKFTVPPQKLPAKFEDDYWTYYVGDKVTSYDAIIGTRFVFGGLKVSKPRSTKNSAVVQHDYGKQNTSKEQSGDSNKQTVAIFGNSTSVTLTPKPAPDFEIGDAIAFDRPSFTQELIYNGRSGDTVKFLYRELSNSMLRAPFTQDIQYDLKQSPVVGFKGVRIEIVDATNTQLKYKVLTSFPTIP